MKASVGELFVFFCVGEQRGVDCRLFGRRQVCVVEWGVVELCVLL